MARSNRNNSKYEAKSAEQQQAAEAIRVNDYTWLYGDAGTGKTYAAAGCAVEWLKANKIGRIVLLRAAVGAGEDLGFLPGTKEEKIDPYLKAVNDAIGDYDTPDDDVKANTQKGSLIEKATFQHLRGVTFSNAFVIVEEAQNATPNQIKLALTRLGYNAKMVLTGDTDQSDIGGRNGLADALVRLQDVPRMAFVRFTSEVSNCRHNSIPEILKRYRETEREHSDDRHSRL